MTKKEAIYTDGDVQNEAVKSPWKKKKSIKTFDQIQHNWLMQLRKYIRQVCRLILM